jgi:hypothetical protein
MPNFKSRTPEVFEKNQEARESIKRNFKNLPYAADGHHYASPLGAEATDQKKRMILEARQQRNPRKIIAEMVQQ